MNRRFFFCTLLTVSLTLLAAPGQALAGKIFVLTAADTSESGKVALSTGPDLGFLFDVFYANVPGPQMVFYNMDTYDKADEEGSTMVKIKKPWMGPEIRYDLGDMQNKLLTAIDNCPAGPDDAVVFFFSGHGAHDKDGHYIVMPDHASTLSRKDIVQRPVTDLDPTQIGLIWLLDRDAEDTQTFVGVVRGRSVRSSR